MEEVSPVPLAASCYAVDVDGEVYLPVIAARNPGHGEGGEFLDSLPRDKTIKVPGVISAILEGMLERRGFVLEWESFEDRDIDVWTRWAS